jgi:hypothetical protein
MRIVLREAGRSLGFRVWGRWPKVRPHRDLGICPGAASGSELRA